MKEHIFVDAFAVAGIPGTSGCKCVGANWRGLSGSFDLSN